MVKSVFQIYLYLPVFQNIPDVGLYKNKKNIFVDLSIRMQVFKKESHLESGELSQSNNRRSEFLQYHLFLPITS